VERVLRVLEYNKIIDGVRKHASSQLGIQKIEHLAPSFDIREVNRWHEETDEGAKVLRLKGHVPLGGIHDIRASLKRSEIGGLLNAAELLEIADTILGGRRIRSFVEKMGEDDIELPLLSGFVSQLAPEKELETNIKTRISDDGNILDSASDKLRVIRGKLRSYESKVREKLEHITRSSHYQKMLSDAIVTIRNDRYVIPVKQEYRGSLGGMVHDQSASGATLFIEPQAVVNLNNELKEARVKEKQEIERILAELSAETAQSAEILYTNVDVLADIDFIFAKAQYGKNMKASKPKLNTNGVLSVKKARHPLIPASEVVPIDVDLGDPDTSLIITGPNTGGKTVTLKTLGLLTLMAQSGLQIPAEDGSTMAVFQSIYADIGDEQSIEQNLSTFSSHMTNIIEILKQVDSQSLVLFDELGAGTDPQEGAALAISILDNVHDLGARVVATTHYSELKAYAYEREGILNASVEFDVETLSPTYRLLIGIPGRSNAFEISKRLGLGAELIDAAKKQISSETNKVDKMIASLEENQKRANDEREEAESIRREAAQLHYDLEKKIKTLETERGRILEKAEKQAKEEVTKAKQKAESIIQELRERQKKHGSVKEHHFIDAKRKLEEAEPSFKRKEKPALDRSEKKVYEPGAEVKVMSFNQKGHIVEKLDGGEYLVQLGIMKMNVKADDLKPLKSEPKREPKTIVSVKGSGSHLKTELDLRGKRYEEAMNEVEKYLDDALLAGYPQVSVIHGKGTGALRKGVANLLKAHPNVKSTRMGESGEGGSGVTVVQL
jgi:DNA mismatch repair protein MutS2